MKWQDSNRNTSDIEALLAAEREAPAESQELQNRILERAVLSLQHQATLPLEVFSPGPRQLSFGLAAAAAVMLTGLCAAAFVAGYKSKSESPAVPAGSSAPSSLARVPAPSVVVLIPVPASTISAPISSDSVAHIPRVNRQGQAENAPATAANGEAFAAELRLLQPARQAVARGEYSSALSIIAEHRRLYPRGVLTQEREALRVKALLGLGRANEAERAGSEFRKRFPRSALVGRIDEMLGKRE